MEPEKEPEFKLNPENMKIHWNQEMPTGEVPASVRAWLDEILDRYDWIEDSGYQVCAYCYKLSPLKERPCQCENDE